MQNFGLSSESKEKIRGRVNDLYNQLMESKNTRGALVRDLDSGLAAEFDTIGLYVSDDTPFLINDLVERARKKLPAEFARDYKALISATTVIAEIILNAVEEEVARDQNRNPQSLKIDFGFLESSCDQSQGTEVPMKIAEAKSFIEDFATSAAQNLFRRAVYIVEAYTIDDQNLSKTGRVLQGYSNANSDMEYDILCLYVSTQSLDSLGINSSRGIIKQSIEYINKVVTFAQNPLPAGSSRQSVR